MTTRIAMWSGPRNISTAMMRSFENRDDTDVIDEPFYAYYLSTTGINHPMRTDVINSQDTDFSTIVRTLTQSTQADRNAKMIFYQKHMTHHMLPEANLDWTSLVLNCFLIRDPAYVVASYAKKRQTVTEQDIGIVRQWRLYQEISDLTKQTIPVIDARQFLLKPEQHLQQLCKLFKIPFSENMLRWPKGRRASDGIWASHWYEKVEDSTGFIPFEETSVTLTAKQQLVVDQSKPYYEQLLASQLIQD